MQIDYISATFNGPAISMQPRSRWVAEGVGVHGSGKWPEMEPRHCSVLHPRDEGSKKLQQRENLADVRARSSGLPNPRFLVSSFWYRVVPMVLTNKIIIL